MTRTCIHGLPGCLMPGPHDDHECHDEAMVEADRQAYYEEESEQIAGIIQSLLDGPSRIAREVLRQLDERLHPWGERGEWPAPGTACWVLYRDEVHDSEVLLEGVDIDDGKWELRPCVYLSSYEESFCIDSEEGQEMRLRKRWAPAPPSARALDAALVVGKGDLPLAQNHVLADIAAERTRQREVHGCTDALDNLHRHGELATAAASYALAASNDGPIRAVARSLWPWSETLWKKAPGRRMLVKAAALIVAEIERLDRARGKGA